MKKECEVQINVPTGAGKYSFELIKKDMLVSVNTTVYRIKKVKKRNKKLILTLNERY